MQTEILSFKRNDMAANKWLETARGRLFLKQERQQLKAVMPSVLGYRMLQIGRWGDCADATGSSAILRHWIFDDEASAGVAAVVDTGKLPVATRSMDAVMLPHSLEFTEHPHRLLREADRVLCPRGQMILLGFNPYHPEILMRYWPSKLPWYPALNRLYSVGRTSDWLGLLDYEVEQVVYFGHGFPWMKTKIEGSIRDPRAAQKSLTGFKGWQNLIARTGQAYLIFARKRVIPLTPARRRWEARLQLGPMAMPEARVSRLHHLPNKRTTTE